MSTIGIKSIKLALVDKNGYVLTGTNGILKYYNDASHDTHGIFTADESTSKGVSSLDVSGLSGANTDVSVDNKIIKKQSTKTSPQSTIVVNSLPYEIKMAIFGENPDSIGGSLITGESNNENYLAYLVETQDAFSGLPLYIGLYMGNAYAQSLSFQTSTDSMTYNVDTFLVDHVERDNGFGKKFYSGLSSFNEDEMLSDIFKVKE